MLCFWACQWTKNAVGAIDGGCCRDRPSWLFCGLWGDGIAHIFILNQPAVIWGLSQMIGKRKNIIHPHTNKYIYWTGFVNNNNNEFPSQPYPSLSSPILITCQKKITKFLFKCKWHFVMICKYCRCLPLLRTIFYNNIF